MTSLATSAGRDLLLGHKAVALLERLHLEGIHLVDDLSNSSCNCGVALDVDAAGEHQVDGAIELGLGLGQLAFAVVGLAAGIGVLPPAG